MDPTSYTPLAAINGDDNDHCISQGHCKSKFELLAAEFEALAPQPPAEGAQPGGLATAPAIVPAASLGKAIIDDTRERPDTLDWSKVYQLHRCVLALLNDDELRRAAWAIRDSYREMFGEREYATYLASDPPKPIGNESGEAVRADLDRLLHLTYANLLMGPVNSRMLRRRVRATMITICVGLVLLGILLAWPFQKREAGATLLTVGIVGSMGGFVSVLLRLRQLGGTGDPLTDFHEIQGVRYSTTFAAGATGALFAGVLFLLFAGGLLTGEFFPKLGPKAPDPSNSTSSGGQPAGGLPSDAAKPAPGVQPAVETQNKKQDKSGHHSVYSLLRDSLPQAPKDVALLILWAFMAGFFERLVPDHLNRLLAKKAEAKAA